MEQDDIESLRCAFAESDAGKVRLFSEFAAELRTKYNLPIHLSDEELNIGDIPSEEMLEDIALTCAMNEGEDSGKVSREEIFAVLQG